MRTQFADGSHAGQDQLLGVLIALANAAEGNEYLFTQETEDILLQGLQIALAQEADADLVEEMILRAQEAKWTLIPSCRGCGSPCGRFEPVDLVDAREVEGEEIFAIKREILQILGEKGEEIPQESLLQVLRSVGLFNPTEEMLAPARNLLRDLTGQ